MQKDNGKKERAEEASGRQDAAKSPSRKKAQDQPAAASEADGKRSAARIVGIGASAGGLEALERFFDAMPVDSGLAFVIVQHLSPDFKSMMDELLARRSIMNIRHATSGIRIEPNTVYLNPPRQNLVVEKGMLFLRDPDKDDHPNLPINAFFTSLAKDRRRDAIAIVLSGTGNDGTKGAQSVLQEGGTVVVQDPISAKFENMPRSVIDKGAASHIATPEEMPEILGRLVRGEQMNQINPNFDIASDPEMAILRMLERRYGANFAYYKKSTVGRRLMRRAALNGLQDLTNYAVMLQNDSAELEQLYADLLIGVTAFFRDAAGFDALTQRALPLLKWGADTDRQIRVWVPGCATGEEAYSMAILLSELARSRGVPPNVKIFATDLHHGSLETAGSGYYSADALKELSEELKDRYFDQTGDRYRVNPNLRRLVVFSPHNLLKDPPFTRIDLISCRNVLIYFDEVAQKKVLSLFHFALVKGGILFLGPSESLGEIEAEFETLDSRWRVMRKLRSVQIPGAMRVLPDISNLELSSEVSEQSRRLTYSSPARPARTDRRSLLKAYDSILASYAPASLLVSTSGDVLHVFGNASKYLRVKSGLFSGRVSDVVIEPLKLAIATCLENVRSTHIEPITRGVTYKDDDGKTVTLKINTEILKEDGAPSENVLVSLVELPAGPEPKKTKQKTQIERVDQNTAGLRRVEELERHLVFTEESLQTTIEELETANEELQSTNEELMSANEELQSTNEELHAVNEELYSVSAEHQRKIEELIALTNDMDHLLRCTDVGTIFLDAEHKVRRFTPAIAKAFNLLDRDIGRPIEHITARFAYPGLSQDVTKVAETAVPIEHTVHVDELTLLLRIFPFKVLELVQGIVITLVDVSRLKQTERALEARNHELARANASLEQFTYIVSHDLRAPLRTILNSAKWIEEDLGKGASDEVIGHCERLMTYSKRLTDMLTDLMEYAKLGNGDGKSIEIVNLKDLLSKVADSLDNEGRLSLTQVGEATPFACRRAPLVQVFQNLIDNALKYSDNKTVNVKVLVETHGKLWRFSVTDDGPGIPARHHEKIFLPFRKLEHTETKPGTGMGLALVKKAVQDNGGTIEVISEPDIRPGTTFRFTWEKVGGR